MKRSPLKRKSSITALKRKAITVFNAWIRARDAVRLKGRCYTCRVAWGAEAGHFIHSANSVRFDEMNVNLQCTRCNKWKSGNLGEYALRLEDEFGRTALNDLRHRGETTKKLSPSDYQAIITKYSP